MVGLYRDFEMAKISWERVYRQSLQQTAREQEWQENRQKNFKKRQQQIYADKYWQIGKYKGRDIEKIPNSYLCFVSETFDKASPFKHKADHELRRRYRQLQKQD